MRVVIANDHGAVALKKELASWLESEGHEVVNLGVDVEDRVDYPDIAVAACAEFKKGGYDLGVLLCGTGIGVAIAANKIPGVRAACCHDTYSAERSRASNDAQILTMGARVVGPELALRILDTWLQTEFGGGPSARKVAKITALEQRFMTGPIPRPTHGEDPAQ